jgi:hypothetical protein
MSIIRFLPVAAANNFNANNPEAPKKAKLPNTRKILQNNIASICKL